MPSARSTVVTTQGNANTAVVVKARVSTYKLGMETTSGSTSGLSLVMGDRGDRLIGLRDARLGIIESMR